ncbi:hypothetical protein N566_12535 [Streptomycetaceae bacterium MP113-05]|nr:hypothetical protein N566_12535 [Streptomycetaceae bacterium MP113-05]
MTARTPGGHQRRTTAAAALALACALTLGACSADATSSHEGLEVTGAYLPEPLMTDMAGGYFVIHNHGAEDDRLTGVTSGIADSVDMHRTTGGQMEQVDSLPVPAGGRLELARGGNHLMLHDLKRKPEEGDTVRVTLQFAHHDPVTLQVPVKATNHNPATTGHH